MTEHRAKYQVTPQPPQSGIRAASGSILSERWRCHDGQCRARQSCELWLTRADGDATALHCSTLRERWLMPSEPCGAYTGPPLPEDSD